MNKQQPKSAQEFAMLSGIVTDIAVIKSKMTNTSISMDRIDKHLDKLNGIVAKHNEWINKNHKLVTEDLPGVIKLSNNNDKKLYKIGITLAVVFTTIQVGLNFALKFFG